MVLLNWNLAPVANITGSAGVIGLVDGFAGTRAVFNT